MELGAQQPKQPPQKRDTSSGLIEAVAVQVLDDRPQQEHRQAGGVVIHHYVVSSPAPSVLPIYRSATCCCYPITPEDPIEVLYGRRVAIAHICVEIAGGLFCSLEWCLVTPFLAVLSSSLVACCCKHSAAFMHWSVIGGVLFVLHAITAIVAVAQEAADTARFPLVFFLVQIVLCGVNLLVVYRGCKTASAILRQPVSPVQSQIGTPLQLSAHPVAGVQQHSPVVHVLP